MRVGMGELLVEAQADGYALGAFNVYNLEGVLAVIAAAEAERSAAILQIHPAALAYGGPPLVAACLSAAVEARVPLAVHLDHATAVEAIEAALHAGCGSVMADGSHLPYAANLAFTSTMARLAHTHGAMIEAELGRLSGAEDGLSVAEVEALLTDPDQAAEFVARTGIDALAVCIGNVHGRYRRAPQLDFDRLAAIRQQVRVPLVLHGASGLPEDQIRRSIELGVRKFNVNTELREAYLARLAADLAGSGAPELLTVIRGAVESMAAVVAAKLRLFGSTGRAHFYS